MPIGMITPKADTMRMPCTCPADNASISKNRTTCPGCQQVPGMITADATQQRAARQGRFDIASTGRPSHQGSMQPQRQRRQKRHSPRVSVLARSARRQRCCVCGQPQCPRPCAPPPPRHCRRRRRRHAARCASSPGAPAPAKIRNSRVWVYTTFDILIGSTFSLRRPMRWGINVKKVLRLMLRGSPREQVG